MRRNPPALAVGFMTEAYDLLHDVYTYCLPPHRRWEEEAREVERKIQNFFGTAP